MSDCAKFPNSITAIILDQLGWDELLRKEGKKAGAPFVVPEHRVISIRIPEEYTKDVDEEVIVRVFIEKKDKRGG